MTAPVESPRRPTSTDAKARAAVRVRRPDGTVKTGRLWSVGGDRRCPNGRCKVQLQSGAWLTPRIEDVTLVPETAVTT